MVLPPTNWVEQRLLAPACKPEPGPPASDPDMESDVRSRLRTAVAAAIEQAVKGATATLATDGGAKDGVASWCVVVHGAGPSYHGPVCAEDRSSSAAELEALERALAALKEACCSREAKWMGRGRHLDRLRLSHPHTERFGR